MHPQALSGTWNGGNDWFDEEYWRFWRKKLSAVGNTAAWYPAEHGTIPTEVEPV